MGRRSRRGRELSWSFWRGCGAILLLSVIGCAMLVNGNYKHGVTAPSVPLVPAIIGTAVLAAVAFVALWRWEQRERTGQR